MERENNNRNGKCDEDTFIRETRIRRKEAVLLGSDDDGMRLLVTMMPRGFCRGTWLETRERQRKMEEEKVRTCVFFILDFFVYNVCVCMYVVSGFFCWNEKSIEPFFSTGSEWGSVLHNALEEDAVFLVSQKMKNTYRHCYHLKEWGKWRVVLFSHHFGMILVHVCI